MNNVLVIRYKKMVDIYFFSISYIYYILCMICLFNLLYGCYSVCVKCLMMVF